VREKSTPTFTSTPMTASKSRLVLVRSFAAESKASRSGGIEQSDQEKGSDRPVSEKKNAARIVQERKECCAVVKARKRKNKNTCARTN